MRSLVLIAALCLMPFTNALAQNSEAGQTLAMQVCSRCHAVMPGQGVNPHPPPLPFTKVGEPLPFEDIANTPGIMGKSRCIWGTDDSPLRVLEPFWVR